MNEEYDDIFEGMEEENDEVSFLDLEEADEEIFKDIYDKISEYYDDNDGSSFVSPEDRIVARDWLISSLKLEDEIKYLKDVYIKELEKRYIEPVKKKIEKHTEIIEILKQGLREFLENAEEKKVDFPEIASVGKYDAAEKIIYPEDEKEFAEKLHEQNSEFVRITPSIDKKAIQKAYKEKNELPLSELRTEPGKKTVRITRKKNK